jgi:hypothetical protein
MYAKEDMHIMSKQDTKSFRELMMTLSKAQKDKAYPPYTLVAGRVISCAAKIATEIYDDGGADRAHICAFSQKCDNMDGEDLMRYLAEQIRFCRFRGAYVKHRCILDMGVALMGPNSPRYGWPSSVS